MTPPLQRAFSDWIARNFFAIGNVFFVVMRLVRGSSRLSF
jgi:hypothetical protein